MYAIYSLRDCHYLKRIKIEIKFKNSHCLLGLLQQTMMISSSDHHDLSVVCQAQPTKSLVNKKSGPLQPVRGGNCRRTNRTPPFPPNGPEENA